MGDLFSPTVPLLISQSFSSCAYEQGGETEKEKVDIRKTQTTCKWYNPYQTDDKDRHWTLMSEMQSCGDWEEDRDGT